MDESAYDKRLKRFLIPILRRRSLWWSERNEARKDAKVGPNLWKCKSCKQEVNKIQLDHILPIVNVKTGWVSWDHFLKSLFCEKSNFAALCENCHTTKTQIENEQRKINKKKKKT